MRPNMIPAATGLNEDKHVYSHSHNYLVSLLLGSEQLLVQLCALHLHVTCEGVILLLQLCCHPLQVVSSLLNLQGTQNG